MPSRCKGGSLPSGVPQARSLNLEELIVHASRTTSEKYLALSTWLPAIPPPPPEAASNMQPALFQASQEPLGQPPRVATEAAAPGPQQHDSICAAPRGNPVLHCLQGMNQKFFPGVIKGIPQQDRSCVRDVGTARNRKHEKHKCSSWERCWTKARKEQGPGPRWCTSAGAQPDRAHPAVVLNQEKCSGSSETANSKPSSGNAHHSAW